MKSKIFAILALAFATSSFAAIPAVEKITSDQIAPIFSEWLRHNAAAVGGHRALIVKEAVDKTPVISNDVLLLERFVTTDLIYEGAVVAKPPVVGDIFTFIFQGKETYRVIGSMSGTSVKTLFGTEVMFSDIKGVCRRIIRVTDSTVINIPVMNVNITAK